MKTLSSSRFHRQRYDQAFKQVVELWREGPAGHAHYIVRVSRGVRFGERRVADCRLDRGLVVSSPLKDDTPVIAGLLLSRMT